MATNSRWAQARHGDALRDGAAAAAMLSFNDIYRDLTVLMLILVPTFLFPQARHAQPAGRSGPLKKNHERKFRHGSV